MKKLILLGLSIFASNALIMIFEIIWSRILWPFIGTSILVWSSLIGIILFFISVWNYYGWIIADKRPQIQDIQKIFILSWILVLIIAWGKDMFLFYLYNVTHHILYYLVIVSVLFFWPVSFLLGMVSPIAMKLAISDLDTVGKIVWILNGVSAAGAILGTLCAWFFLIPLFWITTILLSLGSVCIIMWWCMIFIPSSTWKRK